MKNFRKTLLLSGDIIALFLSFFISLRLGYLSDFNTSIYQTHIGPFFIIYFIWIVVIFAFGLYETENIRPTIASFKNIGLSFSVFFFLSLSIFYLFPIFGISPKSNLLINVFVFGVIFILWRRFFFNLFSKNFKRGLIIIGENEASLKLSKEMSKNPHMGYNFVGFANSLKDAIGKKDFSIIVLANKQNFNSEDIQYIFSNKIELLDIVSAYEKILFKVPVEFIDEIWFLNNIKNSNKKIYSSVKRFFELILSVLILIICTPFLLLSAIAIKLEDGRKVIFKQVRFGENNKAFNLYKLQTYVEGAEKNGAEWSQNKDSRITPIGKILRKTHLDETPQIWNILKGDLALIGPRPERPEFIDILNKEIPHFKLRHIIKPGITGWAQIKFKYANNLEDYREKFEYDMYYIKNRNLLMDLGILIRTVQKIFN